MGTIDFVAWSPIHSRAEIGFILSKEHWGTGIILEAASKVIQFGFNNMGLNRIEAPCMVENLQSQPMKFPENNLGVGKYYNFIPQDIEETHKISLEQNVKSIQLMEKELLNFLIL
jgi:hypothetical protein